MTKIRNIYLYGELAEKYGKKFTMAVKSIPEAVHAINTFHPGFVSLIKSGKWHISRGKKRVWEKEDIKESEQLNEKTVNMNFGDGDFHITPAVEGSGQKGKGWLQIILGAVITVLGIVFDNYQLAALGISLMLGGLGTLLIKPPNTNPTENDRPEENRSFLFNGVINTMEEGGSIALTYGKFLVGSTVISSSYKAEEA